MALQGLLALIILPLLAWCLSENRRQKPLRLVAVALALQVGLAFLLLKAPPFQAVFVGLNHLVLGLQQATETGASVVFGYLAGGDLPFTESYPGAAFILAFRALPIILVISALSALLFYWGVLPGIVRGLAKLIAKPMGLSGAASLGAAANVFVGMVEAPLLVRPYIERISRADLFLLMTTGMATIAGTMMVVYAGFLEGLVNNPLGHIITASLISVPAAVMIARLLVPQAGPSGDEAATDLSADAQTAHGAMDAITMGTLQGIKLLASVVALIIVMVALVSLVNQILDWLPDLAGAPLTLERLLGWIMAPVVWMMGIPWAEAKTAGALMGVKTVLNEFIAYLQLSQLPPEALSDKSTLIMAYALNGFANLGSLGIMIGGLAAMAPNRRGEIAALGFKSVLAGTLATMMTGSVVGLIYGF